MSSVNSAGSTPSSSSSSKPDLDPVLRNALRYTVSAREYKLLHRYFLSHADVVKKKTPSPPRYEASVKNTDDYNAASIRASVRLSLSTYAGLKAWELISTKLFSRGKPVASKATTSLLQSPDIRLSGSLGLILFFHRLLFRFFTRLRQSLLTDEAKPFRRRNPRIAKTLTSRLAPAIGASAAGFFLAVHPADQLRVTIAIYAFTRSLEFLYNCLEDRGWFQNKPWWFGSWLLMPAACGQLLHAFVFDRDCFPESFGKFIMSNSPQYIQPRPQGYPASAPWPGTYQIVDSLAEISRSRWPAFVSPIMFPKVRTLPKSLTAIAPITDPAHPTIKSLSCALLHPHDPSCLRNHLTYYIHAFPTAARFFTIIFGALSIFKYKSFIDDPADSLNKLARSILKMSMFLTGAIGTAWGSICFFQTWFPRSFMPARRWYLSGFLAGLWAFAVRKNGRGNFMYSARLSLDSLWKVGVKHGWWRGIKNGDVLLVVASLAVINATYEVDPKAVSGGVLRKGLGMLRGEGWVDRAVAGRRLSEREVKATGVEILDGEAEEKAEQVTRSSVPAASVADSATWEKVEQEFKELEKTVVSEAQELEKKAS